MNPPPPAYPDPVKRRYVEGARLSPRARPSVGATTRGWARLAINVFCTLFLICFAIYHVIEFRWANQRHQKAYVEAMLKLESDCIDTLATELKGPREKALCTLSADVITIPPWERALHDTVSLWFRCTASECNFMGKNLASRLFWVVCAFVALYVFIFLLAGIDLYHLLVVAPHERRLEAKQLPITGTGGSWAGSDGEVRRRRVYASMEDL